MSWGYVPKKLKYARRQKKLRKKYKNFSCLTCAYSEGGCLERSKHPSYKLTSKPIVERCKSWKPSNEAKYGKSNAATSTNSTTMEKEARKGIFGRIFK